MQSSGLATEREGTKSAARRIVAHAFMTLDGVVTEPEEWQPAYVNDELTSLLGRLTVDADTLLLGRTTYEALAQVWRHGEGRPAEAVNGMGKLVASTTSAQSDRDDITVIGGDVMTELAALKQKPGKEITVTGGVTLIRSLLQAGLVDDLHLLVHPLVAGSGQRLFPSAGTRIPLILVEASASSSGVLHLRYRPA